MGFAHGGHTFCVAGEAVQPRRSAVADKKIFIGNQYDRRIVYSRKRLTRNWIGFDPFHVSLFVFRFLCRVPDHSPIFARTASTSCRSGMERMAPFRVVTR